MGDSINGVYPQMDGWSISWKMPFKWMRTGGIPISGNLQIFIDIHRYS